MFNHNAYNLLLFCKEIELWVNGYDNSKARNSRYQTIRSQSFLRFWLIIFKCLVGRWFSFSSIGCLVFARSAYCVKKLPWGACSSYQTVSVFSQGTILYIDPMMIMTSYYKKRFTSSRNRGNPLQIFLICTYFLDSFEFWPRLSRSRTVSV